jgi:hypothetical protein
LNKQDCTKCLWGDQCVSTTSCDFFTPLYDGYEIEQYIEYKREEYYRDWLEYVADEQ